MKAAPMTKKPSFPLMKQGDIQNIYHLQMPRWLFAEPKYMELSLVAKVAYTFLLNRFQLSRLNGWINDDGEVFIVYTRRSLAAEMQVSYHKIIDGMKELARSGLIWERRCGRGDANQIYLALVRHEESEGGSAPFVAPEHEAAGGCPAELDDVPQETGEAALDGVAEGDIDKKSVSAGYRSSGMEFLPWKPPLQGTAAAEQEVPKRDFLKTERETSRGSQTELAEIDQRDPNYIDSSHTEQSHTEVSLSVPPGTCLERADGLGSWWRSLSEQEQLEQILENCALWLFDAETAKVFENAVERLFYTKEYRIGKAVLPQANVRSRLWDLDSTTLQTVERKLHQNQRTIKNTTAYTMAVIFNAICEAQSDLLLDPYLNSMGGHLGDGA